ncbi:MAG: putative aminohydrolase SsnA [Anaerolineae bacterium]|nr:putative aminohydrolase SsnA [Anaerolineae bacterium]
MTLLIHNVTVFTNAGANSIIPDGAVAIEGGKIAAVGTRAELQAQYPEAEKLDGQGRLIMPGFINTHMHFYGTYARGLALTKPMHNFHEILQHLWWALDKVLDLDAVYYSALLPAILSVKKGVTSVIDHHASPNAIDGSLDRIQDALEIVGMRGVLCYEVSDRDGKEIRDKGFAENERYIRKCQQAKANNPEYMFDGMVGLHASFTLDDDSMTQAADLCQSVNRGVHIHMLEDKVDETETQRKYGRGVVERLSHFGLLGSQSITAHGIFLSDLDVDLLANSDTIVVHQAQSNMNNAVGRADVFKLLQRGITVGLGTDGMTPDIRRETMTGYLMHKHHLGDNNAAWGEFETMLLSNNPAIYERLSGQRVGHIEAGAAADVILIDYEPPTPLTSDNVWGHFLFGIVDAPVVTTIINGKIIMQDYVIAGIDEAKLAAESREVARRVWENFNKS